MAARGFLRAVVALRPTGLLSLSPPLLDLLGIPHARLLCRGTRTLQLVGPRVQAYAEFRSISLVRKTSMHRFLSSFAVLPFLLVVGCQNKDESQLSTRQPTKKSNGNWLTVTDDKDALADAVRRSERIKKDEYEQIFAQLGDDYSYISFETIELLSRRIDAAKKLKNKLPADEITPTGIGAALLLCQIHVNAGRNYVVRVFQQGDVNERIRVLHGIDCASYDPESEQVHREFVLTDKRLVEELLRQLDDDNPDVVKAAIQACGKLELPGVYEKLIALLDRPNVPDPGRILYWLSKGPLTEEVLDAAIRVSQVHANNEDHWGLTLFEAFARSEDADLRERARGELKRQLFAWPDKGALGYDVSRSGVLVALAETADESELDWLRATFDKEHGYYAEPLLVALVRLEGDVGRARLLALLQDPENRSIAVQAAGKIYEGSGDEQIVRKLAQISEGIEEGEVHRICNALRAIDGELARKELATLVDGLDPTSRASLFRFLAQYGINVEQTTSRVVTAGLIDEATAELALQKLKARDEHEKGDVPGLLDVLSAANLVVWFDAETGMLPCRHDELVAEFSTQSRGVFMPTAISEQFHQRNEDDFDAEYTLRFVYEGKLYSGRLRNFGDWYDVERTVSMINRALADAQRKQRFVALATDGQTASFVFADPELFSPLADEFHLPLGGDPNEAMNTGKAFERELIEKLKQTEK